MSDAKASYSNLFEELTHVRPFWATTGSSNPSLGALGFALSPKAQALNQPSCPKAVQGVNLTGDWGRWGSHYPPRFRP